MPRHAYVNGRYLPHAQAAVHIEDRGYQFADGVYEVVPVYMGLLVDEGPHLDRLERSLGELDIAMPMSRAALKLVSRELMRRIASPAPRLKAMRRPKALGSRRSGRPGEPAAGESAGVSESLDDPSSAAAALPLRRVDVPYRPRLSSCPPVGPTHRPPDLYGSLSTFLGISE